MTTIGNRIAPQKAITDHIAGAVILAPYVGRSSDEPCLQPCKLDACWTIYKVPRWTMTHDSLCLSFDGGECIEHAERACPCECQCELIARVRRDDLDNRIYAAYKVMARERGNGYAAALRDAAKAVEALHVEWNADGPDHVCDNEDQHGTLLRAVAAIEASGGER